MSSQGTTTDGTGHAAQGTNTDVDFEQEQSKLTTKIASLQLLQEVDRDRIESMRRDHSVQLADIRAAKIHVDEQLNDVQQELHMSQLERNDAQQQVRDLMAALASSQAAHAALIHDLAQLEAQSRDAKHSHAMSQRQQEIKDIAAKVTEQRLVEEKTSLERQCNNLTLQHESSIETIQALERAMSTLQVEVAARTNDLETQRHAATQAQNEITALQAKCVSVTMAYDAASDKLTALRNDMEKQARVMAHMQDTHSADKATAAALLTQLHDVQTAKSALEAAWEKQCQAWDAERTCAKHRVGELEDTIKRLEMANTAWKAKHNATLCHVDVMTSQMEALQTPCTDALAASDETKSARDVEQLWRTNAELHDALVALTAQYETKCLQYDLAVKQVEYIKARDMEITLKLKMTGCHRQMLARALEQSSNQSMEATRLKDELIAMDAAKNAQLAELSARIHSMEDKVQNTTALNNELAQKCDVVEAPCRVADTVKESCNELLGKCDGHDAWCDDIDRVVPALSFNEPTQLSKDLLRPQDIGHADISEDSASGALNTLHGAILAVVVGANRVQAGLMSDQEDGWSLPTLQWKVRSLARVSIVHTRSVYVE
ncbi:hypothetical protein DYB32_010747 [Aphanomyces invadans]|uniref:Uncharacterized protein n=1 Tax=Aphanomyces invadans TaxID=157072 RepID=A0A3R7A163_9STRA|nr:hypothetical protein DYB32_010747 [Aphanomyces invadans]